MISVIVPLYNAKKYLHRCIDSILAQTFTDFELLLVDDGSTDSSDAICDEYAEKDSRVRVFHKKNGGVSSARNLGLVNTKGEYVMFVDSDDYMLPTMCELMLRTIENKSADLVVCGTTETGGGFWRPRFDEDFSKEQLKERFVSLLHTELLSPPWNKIYKKVKIGNLRFREDISFGEDLLFNIQYLDICNKISFIKESPYYHEKGNTTSLVVNFNQMRLYDIEKVWNVIEEFSIEKKNLYNKYLHDLAIYSRQLLKTNKIQWEEKGQILRQWHVSSLLRKVHILQYNTYITNLILLVLLKFQCWKLADILVNIKTYISIIKQ